MEDNLFNIETALDSAATRKEQEELHRKRNKFRKKLKKLKRRAGNVDIDNSRPPQNEEWV